MPGMIDVPEIVGGSTYDSDIRFLLPDCRLERKGDKDDGQQDQDDAMIRIDSCPS